VAALKQDLVPAELVRLRDLPLDLFRGKHVAFVVPRRAVERAERAERVAEVRVVDVAVDDVRDDLVRMLLAAHEIGHHAERREIRVLDELDRFVARDSRRHSGPREKGSDPF